jgi:UDP-N-acetylglucosamine 2-epimerase
VEAGLRSSNLESPWPEELNRNLIDRFADFLFAPTLQAVDQLKLEDAPGEIVLTGNTGIDAVLQIAKTVDYIKPLNRIRSSSLPPQILVTQHRRENIGNSLSQIIVGINKLAEHGFEIYFPTHANPQVKAAVEQELISAPNVHLIPALDYTEMLKLMAKIDLIITDSGGLQEEGPALGIPVLVTRESTERPEGISSGSNVLVGVDSVTIETTAKNLLTFSSEYTRMASAHCPYGDGNASKIISDFLYNHYH